MSEDKLEEIKDILLDIRSILLVSNAKEIKDFKDKFMKEKSDQVKIYTHCKGLTNEEIAKKVKKSKMIVNTNLARLREKGLIKSIQKNNKIIHEQII